MILYGASGHGKVIIDCLESQNIDIEGIFDEDESIKTLLGYSVLGQYNPDIFPDNKIIISIGQNKIRKNLSSKVVHEFGTVLNNTATIAKNVQIDFGTVIFHKSVVQTSSVIGKHVIINTAASVDHDCKIEDFVHISPNVTLCGNVAVGEGTQIGAGAIVLPNLSIGKWVSVGAGTIITKNVPDYSVIVGNPGKIIKYNR